MSAEGRVEHQKLNQTAALLSFGRVFGVQLDSLDIKSDPSNAENRLNWHPMSRLPDFDPCFCRKLFGWFRCRKWKCLSFDLLTWKYLKVGARLSAKVSPDLGCPYGSSNFQNPKQETWGPRETMFLKTRIYTVFRARRITFFLVNRVENKNEPKRPQKWWPFGFVLVFN